MGLEDLLPNSFIWLLASVPLQVDLSIAYHLISQNEMFQGVGEAEIERQKGRGWRDRQTDQDRTYRCF
jgi:hypothetical protein